MAKCIDWVPLKGGKSLEILEDFLPFEIPYSTASQIKSFAYMHVIN